MALILHNPGVQPLGQFDGYTADTLSFKGGEVCTFRAMPYPAAGANDVDQDGYVTSTSYGKEVPAISFNWTQIVSEGGSAATGPFFLSDDGTAGYGTLFGSVVGGSVGQVTTTGAVLGPHTATGSGKITVWDKPGLYGVTLDAVDSNLTATANVKVGTPLYYNGSGQICLTGQKISGALVIGRLASFETNGSLVTTPMNLVQALNSPSGNVTSLAQQKMSQLVFWYNGAGGNA